MTDILPSSLGFHQEEVRTYPERHFDTNWSFCSPKTIIYMLTACSRLPFSCQRVPKWVLKFSWVTSDLAVTQDWQISQGSCCSWASGRWNAGWAHWPAANKFGEWQTASFCHHSMRDSLHRVALPWKGQPNSAFPSASQFPAESLWISKAAQEWQETRCQ